MSISSRAKELIAASSGKGMQRHALSRRILGLQQQKQQINHQIHSLNVQMQALRTNKRGIRMKINTLRQQMDTL
jgi:prefoldin subunit 5